MTEHFDCLSIPKGQMKNDFLTLEEQAIMLQKMQMGIREDSKFHW